MPGGAPGKDDRLRAGDEGRDLVVLLGPGRDAIPAKAVIQREVRESVPAILREETDVFVPRVKGVELALVVLARHADQEIGEVDAGFRSGENEAAIELGDGVSIDLVGMELPAKLHRVIAQHLGNRIGDLIGVVDLNELVGRGAGGVSVEVEVLDALSLGIESNDAGGSVGILEALRGQAYAETAHGLTQVRVKSRM